MLDRMVREIREVEEALACPPDARAPQEDMNATVAHKSIVALRDIAAGEVLSSENIAVMRPGIGLAPRLWDVVCGSQVMTALAAGTPLQWEHLLRKMMN
jgi:N-acetylneuraminate synthase/N,N'-diacetyllegionaminate synthase